MTAVTDSGQLYWTFEELEKEVETMTFDQCEKIVMSLMADRERVSNQLDILDDRFNPNNSLYVRFNELSKKISIVLLRMSYAIMED